jgi:hypothetical protein
MKASFHPSRQLELTDREREHLARVETRRQQSSAARFVDSTEHIYRYFRDSYVTDDDLLLSLDAVNSGSDANLEDAAPEAPSVFTTLAFTCAQPLLEDSRPHPNTDHALLANIETDYDAHSDPPGPGADNTLLSDARNGTADDLSRTALGGSHADFDAHGTFPDDSNAAPTLDEDFNITDEAYYDLPFSLGLALSHGPEQVEAISPWTEPEYPLNEAETLDVLQSFITNSATWCETTDSHKNFSAALIHDIAAHKLCMAAALALTCRHRSVFDASYNETALKLYQYTIQLLIRQNPNHTDPFVLTACILLCVYEMISADVADWRRHLKVSQLRHHSVLLPVLTSPL